MAIHLSYGEDIIMDKEQIRKLAEEKIKTIYGLKNPSAEEVAGLVKNQFNPTPIVQFPGFMQMHPLFGIFQGVNRVTEHYRLFYETIEVKFLDVQFVIVDGFSAAVHCESEFYFKENGSTFALEFVALVEPDLEGNVRTLKLFFDTANFLNAVKNPGKKFTDVRGKDPHPDFDPNAKMNAGVIMADTFYNTFVQAYIGQIPFDRLYEKMADGVEVVFKSDVEILPYAGRHSGIDGFRQWFKDLFSTWNLCAFNFTRIFAEGNIADFEIHELHYYNNPDGSKRYLDVYIVQSWLVDENGNLHRFKSYHDSAWLVETYKVTDTYKSHYGYPADYPPGSKA